MKWKKDRWEAEEAGRRRTATATASRARGAARCPCRRCCCSSDHERHVAPVLHATAEAAMGCVGVHAWRHIARGWLRVHSEWLRGRAAGRADDQSMSEGRQRSQWRGCRHSHARSTHNEIHGTTDSTHTRTRTLALALHSPSGDQNGEKAEISPRARCLASAKGRAASSFYSRKRVCGTFVAAMCVWLSSYLSVTGAGQERRPL